jgi:peptidyl-prolyl cis-trans isomerase SurA
LLGYITAFMTFPEFEQPCFTDSLLGAISSDIFRTQYGYHILHVLEKRPARGTYQGSPHLSQRNQRSQEEAEKQMQEAYKHGNGTKKMTFEDAVKKYTEDASTKETKGVLTRIWGE